MSYGNDLRSAGFASTMFLLGCAAAFTPQDPVQQTILESLSVAGYQRAVPRLAALKAGERIQERIDWKFFSIQEPGTREYGLGVGDGGVGAAPLRWFQWWNRRVRPPLCADWECAVRRARVRLSG